VAILTTTSTVGAAVDKVILVVLMVLLEAVTVAAPMAASLAEQDNQPKRKRQILRPKRNTMPEKLTGRKNAVKTWNTVMES